MSLIIPTTRPIGTHPQPAMTLQVPPPLGLPHASRFVPLFPLPLPPASFPVASAPGELDALKEEVRVLRNQLSKVIMINTHANKILADQIELMQGYIQGQQRNIIADQSRDRLIEILYNKIHKMEVSFDLLNEQTALPEPTHTKACKRKHAVDLLKDDEDRINVTIVRQRKKASNTDPLNVTGETLG